MGFKSTISQSLELTIKLWQRLGKSIKFVFKFLNQIVDSDQTGPANSLRILGLQAPSVEELARRRGAHYCGGTVGDLTLHLLELELKWLRVWVDVPVVLLEGLCALWSHTGRWELVLSAAPNVHMFQWRLCSLRIELRRLVVHNAELIDHLAAIALNLDLSLSDKPSLLPRLLCKSKFGLWWMQSMILLQCSLITYDDRVIFESSRFGVLEGRLLVGQSTVLMVLPPWEPRWYLATP